MLRPLPFALLSLVAWGGEDSVSATAAEVASATAAAAVPASAAVTAPATAAASATAAATAPTVAPPVQIHSRVVMVRQDPEPAAARWPWFSAGAVGGIALGIALGLLVARRRR